MNPITAAKIRGTAEYLLDAGRAHGIANALISALEYAQDGREPDGQPAAGTVEGNLYEAIKAAFVADQSLSPTGQAHQHEHYGGPDTWSARNPAIGH